MKKIDAVIVSGGNIQDDFALDFLNESTENGRTKWIAADKGIEFFIRNKLQPHDVIGDFDSADPAMQIYLDRHSEISVHRLPPEKDDSDTQAALRLACKYEAKSVLLLGCLGTRMDHMIANLGLLLMGRTLGMEVEMVDAYNRITLAKSGMTVYQAGQFGTYISFFALGGPVEGLTLTGFRYPLVNHRLAMEDAGLTVSNEIRQEKAVINYTGGDLLMIESRDTYPQQNLSTLQKKG